MKEKMLSYIEENQQWLFDVLCEMIDINTENDGAMGAESALAAYMQRKYEELGVPCTLYTPDSVPGLVDHPDHLKGRNTDKRQNITACIKGDGSKGSLMLAGHLDTVPIGDRALWTTPPTAGVIRDGKIFGRGACDDKFALAVELFLAKAFCELGITPPCDLYLNGYVDEEFGGGNGALAAVLRDPCDFTINMDSDHMDIVHCGVGGQRLALILRHRKVQDACNDMIEAIHLTKQCIDRFGARRISELSRNPYFKGTPIPQKALRYMNVVTGLNTNDRHLGTVDFAFYTDRDRAQIETEYKALFSEIETTLAPLHIFIDKIIWRSRFFNYAASDKANPQIKRLRVAAEKQTGKAPAVCGMCLSDLNLFIHHSNGNAVSFGVGRDFAEVGGAHQPDEFVICEELVRFVKVLSEYILE